MSSPTSEGHPLRTVKFVSKNYGVLKGWCYLPIGLLFAALTILVAIVRPVWLAEYQVGGLLIFGACLLGAPWAWWMNKQYVEAYGMVGTSWSFGSPGTPMARLKSYRTSWMYAALLVGILGIGSLNVFVGQSEAFHDNMFVVFIAGYLLMIKLPETTHRSQEYLYTACGLLLFSVAALPLIQPDPYWGQVFYYTGLGLIIAGLGWYHHRYLTSVFGPMQPERETAPA